MDTLKQVRVRKIVDGANTGALDLRVMLLQGTASTSQRIARGQVSISSQLYWSEVIYEGPRYQDKSNDDILKEYIESNSEIEANKIGSKLGTSLFKIVQDPWSDEVPQLRKFGEDPYYLNNGAYINISWRKNLEISYQFEAYEVFGNGTESNATKILIDTAIFLDGFSPSDIDVELPNFFELNYKNSSGTGSIDEFYGITLSNTFTLQSALAHAQNAALNDGFEQYTGDYVVSVSGFSTDLTLPKAGPSNFTRNISGYEYSDESLKEVNTPNYIFKSFYVVPNPVKQPSIDDPAEEYERYWSFDDKYNPRYILEFAGGITNSVIPVSLTYSYDVKDEFIISNILENWVKNLSTSYPSAKNYNLRLANPSYTMPTSDLINDYSPKKDFSEAKVFKWETVGDNPNVLTPNPATGGTGSVAVAATQSEPVVLIKMNPVFPENWIVKTDEPAPQFQIWVGDIEADIPVEGFIYSDETDNLEGLSPEFLEEAFAGEEEQIDFNLNDPIQSEFGESGGLELEDPNASTAVSTAPVVAAETASTSTPDVEVSSKTYTDSASKGGGTGQKRFQQKLSVQGRTVYNGDLPSNLLAKLDFCGHKIEKNAVKKLNELNKAFKAKFGKDMKITDGYRTFTVQNKIFDWDYYDTGLNPYTKKVDTKNKGRKVGSFNAKKPTGVAAAPPGTSKHGWGQAVDIDGMGNGPGNEKFEWMEANAKKYGWVNPPWAKKSGATYEPWHWEYNGTDLFKA